MSRFSVVRFNPDYEDKSMRIHGDGRWILYGEYQQLLSEHAELIQRLADYEHETETVKELKEDLAKATVALDKIYRLELLEPVSGEIASKYFEEKLNK